MKAHLHRSCLLHVCLVYDSDLRVWDPEDRRKCVRSVHALLKNFIGKPGYFKNMDFYYSLVFWVLQNNKERDLVLSEVLNFLLEELTIRMDMIGNRDRFYRFIDICNQNLDLSRYDSVTQRCFFFIEAYIDQDNQEELEFDLKRRRFL